MKATVYKGKNAHPHPPRLIAHRHFSARQTPAEPSAHCVAGNIFLQIQSLQALKY
jgi:hypothetical protein